MLMTLIYQIKFASVQLFACHTKKLQICRLPLPPGGVVCNSNCMTATQPSLSPPPSTASHKRSFKPQYITKVHYMTKHNFLRPPGLFICFGILFPTEEIKTVYNVPEHLCSAKGWNRSCCP